MSKATVYDRDGKAAGEVELADAVFGLTPHTAVLHEAVRWQLAGRHRGTHSTLTRGMVSRSTRKLYRQKGTGRARHGARGAPVFVGGGIVFGPRPRSYRYTLPKKVRRLALRSALSARAAEGRIVVLDRLDLDAPKTKTVAAALRAAGLGVRASGVRSVLLVTAAPSEAVERSAANLDGVRVAAASALNVHAILAADRIVFTRDALQRLVEGLGS
ncbi:MAG TPA: 50S ribosomal protein L4 [bacterium]|nr:50S ribosomal protein L4 [bacterium]